MRPDLEIISEWIAPESSLLDLGCGDGELLLHLKNTKGVRGVGVEIEIGNVVRCIEKGLNVIQGDLNDGLSPYFVHRAFDYVVMTQTLQAVKQPAHLLEEMLHVGSNGVVTFPNMGYWKNRLQFLLGKMPVTRALPAQWHETQNTHLCTIRDFETLCKERNIRILTRTTRDYTHHNNLWSRLAPNPGGEIAIYHLRLSSQDS